MGQIINANLSINKCQIDRRVAKATGAVPRGARNVIYELMRARAMKNEFAIAIGQQMPLGDNRTAAARSEQDEAR